MLHRYLTQDYVGYMVNCMKAGTVILITTQVPHMQYYGRILVDPNSIQTRGGLTQAPETDQVNTSCKPQAGDSASLWTPTCRRTFSIICRLHSITTLQKKVYEPLLGNLLCV